MARPTKKGRGGAMGDSSPRPRLLVLPFLRRPAQRLIMPDWVAITIGSTIFAWRTLTAEEMAHEMAHVRQWREHGLMFIPRYLAASAAAARGGGDRYRDNAFEVEARGAEAAARGNTTA